MSFRLIGFAALAASAAFISHAFRADSAVGQDGGAVADDPLRVLFAAYADGRRGLAGEAKDAYRREWATRFSDAVDAYPNSPSREQVLHEAIAMETALKRYAAAAALSAKAATGGSDGERASDLLMTATLHGLAADQAIARRSEREDAAAAAAASLIEADRLIAEAEQIVRRQPGLLHEVELVRQLEAGLISTAASAAPGTITVERQIDLLERASAVRGEAIAAGVPADEVYPKSRTHLRLAILFARRTELDKVRELTEEILDEGESVPDTFISRLSREAYPEVGPEALSFAMDWVKRHPGEPSSALLAADTGLRLDLEGFHDAALVIDAVTHEQLAMQLAEADPGALERGDGGPLSRVLGRLERNLRRAGRSEEAAAIGQERAALFPVEVARESRIRSRSEAPAPSP